MHEQTSRPDRPYEGWINEEARQKKLEHQPPHPEKPTKLPHPFQPADTSRLMDRPDKKPM